VKKIACECCGKEYDVPEIGEIFTTEGRTFICTGYDEPSATEKQHGHLMKLRVEPISTLPPMTDRMSRKRRRTKLRP
jgi:hypothetical protein